MSADFSVAPLLSCFSLMSWLRFPFTDVSSSFKRSTDATAVSRSSSAFRVFATLSSSFCSSSLIASSRPAAPLVASSLARLYLPSKSSALFSAASFAVRSSSFFSSKAFMLSSSSWTFFRKSSATLRSFCAARFNLTFSWIAVETVSSVPASALAMAGSTTLTPLLAVVGRGGFPVGFLSSAGFPFTSSPRSAITLSKFMSSKKSAPSSPNVASLSLVSTAFSFSLFSGLAAPSISSFPQLSNLEYGQTTLIENDLPTNLLR
mmetsp:Transcript_47938/g.79419  ORF Transcript_47938/g.79419 Transcript_47938/m.79419 type:complete len:262 (-) Transcript_47938:214-999(-)